MSIADVTNILKHDYKDLHHLVNDSVGLCAQLDQNTTDIHGDYAVIAMEVGLEYGTGWRLENEVLPPGRSVPPQQATVKVKRCYGKYRMTVPEMKAMETDKGAFTRAQPRRIENLMKSCKRNYAHGTWGDGSGALVTCGTTANSTTVQLAASTPEQALVNLVVGKQVDIGTKADPQLIASDRKIVSVDFANARVVIDGAPVTTTGSHFLFEQGGGGLINTPTQRALTGIQNLIDDDSVNQGLDPASVWAWGSLVDGNGGTLRPPSENLLERVVHRLENRSGAMVDALWAGDGVYRAMVNSLKGRQRVVNDLTLKGGHKAIDYTFGAESMPLVRDRDAEVAGPNSLWGIEYRSIQVYIQSDWGWEDTDGQTLRLATDGTHSLEAIYYTFRELGVNMRNHNFRIDDLQAA